MLTSSAASSRRKYTSRPAKGNTEETHYLQQVRELADGQLHIAEDRTQQPGTDRLTGMYGNCGGPAVGVPEKDMTPAGPVHGKARSFEGANEFFSLEAWKARHTETC